MSTIKGDNNNLPPRSIKKKITTMPKLIEKYEIVIASLKKD